MPAKSTGDTPARIVLNLDTLEAEGRPEPFVFRVHGKDVALSDPDEIDWQVVAAAARLIDEDPETFFKTFMTGKDYAHFASKPLPIRKTRELAAAWRKHYGLIEDEGN